MNFKFGKLPRHFDPRIQKLRSLYSNVLAPPKSCDWTKGVKQFGMMLNDSLGDCTCAAVYHARQIWTLNASTENTQPDSSVLALYEKACGYNPNDPSTDQGGVEQNVLSYLLNHGAPLANGQVDKIIAFAEVNQLNLSEVMTAIYEFGLAYIGFQVPQSIFDSNGSPKSVWDFEDENSPILGGHAVILPGYDESGLTVISWGQLYKMTPRFLQAYCEESYAIVSKDWIKASGKTPLGLTIQQLESMMNGLRE
jgi:hypothetical protein